MTRSMLRYWPDPHDERRLAVLQVDLSFKDCELSQDLVHVALQIIISKQTDDFCQRPAPIALPQAEDFGHAGGKVLDAKIVVEEDRCDLRTVQQVLQVIVQLRKEVVLRHHFGVDSLELPH